MEKCIIHFEQVSEEHLVELKDRASWETLLNAAKIRKFEPIIEIDKNLGESDIPAIKYHRKCRSLFTLKRDLQKLNSENDKTLLSTSSNIRSSNRNSTSLQRRECEKLPFNCIFCQSTKRIKGTETKEKLNLCVELRADKLIKEASLLQNDPRIVALCTDDLIAKEAAYHKSCYRDFTRIVTAKKSEAIEQENEEELDISFDAVEDFIKDLIENPDIAEYKLLTDIFEEELRKSNMTDEYIKNAKKNLRRKIERNIPNVNFINVRRKLFIYPDSLSKTDIITIYLENKFELDNLKSKSNSEKGIVSSALMIREKIKLLKDTMPWPPNVNDLDTSKINITDYLGLFLNTLLSGSSMESSSSKVNRLKLSIGQDLVYAISNGRIKTPKSILYPYAIKSLTNSTKLITINNQLGHGISASILEELATENAFRVLENQLENSVLLHGVSTEVFTMTVHDNIDRNEETLSGKFKLNVGFKSKLFSCNYCTITVAYIIFLLFFQIYYFSFCIFKNVFWCSKVFKLFLKDTSGRFTF